MTNFIAVVTMEGMLPVVYALVLGFFTKDDIDSPNQTLAHNYLHLDPCPMMVLFEGLVGLQSHEGTNFVAHFLHHFI